MLRLAIPVVLTYLGQMAMAMVDLIYVGRISPVAVGAVGLGSSVFAWFMIFGIGLLTGLDYLVSHAHGAGKPEDGHQALIQGFLAMLGLGIPFTLICYFVAGHLEFLGVQGQVAAETQTYLKILSLSLMPVFIFNAARNYLQALGHARSAMVILILANIVNLVLNYVFVLGHWGVPALGTAGSAIATLIARVVMMIAMLVCLLSWDLRRNRYFKSIPIALERQTMRKLLALGLPSALQMLFEVGVFATSTTLAARLTTIELAAHQIVLNLASFTFMVPLGIGSATAVLVGQARGRGDLAGAARMGWKGITLGTSFMLFSGVAMLVFPTSLLGLYSTDPSVIAMGRSILFIAALFQLSDGAQTVLTGALRGTADSRTPMIANLFGHWLFGLPVGVALSFHWGWGLKGLWIGLSFGLTAVAAVLLWKWVRSNPNPQLITQTNEP